MTMPIKAQEVRCPRHGSWLLADIPAGGKSCPSCMAEIAGKPRSFIPDFVAAQIDTYEGGKKRLKRDAAIQQWIHAERTQPGAQPGSSVNND